MSASTATTSALPRFLRRGNVARAWRERLTSRVIAMLRECDSIVLATADAETGRQAAHAAARDAGKVF